MAGVFLTSPAPVRSITKRTDITVPSSGTAFVDSVSYTTRAMIKWIVLVTNISTQAQQSYEILTTFHSGATAPTYTIYARVGDIVKNKAEVVLGSGSTIRLQITNAESSDIVVSIARYKIVT